MGIDVSLESKAMSLLETYNGANNYLNEIKRKSQINKRFYPTRSQSEYIIANHDKMPKVEQQEPGNMKFSLYQKQLDDLGVEIFMGDYLGYYETEDRVRYYSVSDDGYVRSDNKHSYGGYKPFYRTIMATYVSENEFRGI